MFKQPYFRRSTLVTPLAALLLGVCQMGPARASNLSFALFGDVYMTPAHQGYLKGMLDDMADKNEDLALFTGGIKPAEQGCQDQNLLAAYPIFASAPLPTIYVPGDADWALCGKGSAEDRLTLLRKTYFQGDRSLGNPSLPLTREARYPELMRWQSGPAIFVTLNVTGENNLWGRKTEATPEFQARNSAVLAWLQEAFETARRDKIEMLVIVMYGNPEFEQQDTNTVPSGYQPLLDQLKSEVANFAGQVLLVHGGSGVHRIDHPLLNASNLPYQNFTRVETYGATQQGWVQVEIVSNRKAGDDSVRRTEFRFESFPWPPLSLDAEPEGKTKDQ